MHASCIRDKSWSFSGPALGPKLEDWNSPYLKTSILPYLSYSLNQLNNAMNFLPVVQQCFSMKQQLLSRLLKAHNCQTIMHTPPSKYTVVYCQHCSVLIWFTNIDFMTTNTDKFTRNLNWKCLNQSTKLDHVHMENWIPKQNFHL